MARAAAKKERDRRPPIFREPQLPTASRFEKVPQVQAVITQIENGDFFTGCRLMRQMWQNPRLRVALSTRLAGLTSADQRWRPARENRDGRAAQKAIEEDWRCIISTASRKQLGRFGLLLGVGFGQPAWYTSPSTGREIPRAQVFDSCWAKWSWPHRQYAIQTGGFEVGQDGRYLFAAPAAPGIEYVDSPALTAGEGIDPRWFVHEPWGENSWREGYILAAWYSWLGNNLSRRDGLRGSEKVAEGNLLADIPHGADKQAALDFRDGAKNMRGGAVVPCEEMEDGRKFNLRPLEWSAGNSSLVVESTLAWTAADLTVLFLGQTWTTDSKSAPGGAVQGGLEVSSDYIEDDAETETDTLHRQLIRPWAERNFGDPDLAPIREVVTDPPEHDKAAATIYNLISQSLAGFREYNTEAAEKGLPPVEIPALLERFRLPLGMAGKAQVQVPAAPDAPAQPNDTPSPPNDGGAQGYR